MTITNLEPVVMVAEAREDVELVPLGEDEWNNDRYYQSENSIRKRKNQRR